MWLNSSASSSKIFRTMVEMVVLSKAFSMDGINRYCVREKELLIFLLFFATPGMPYVGTRRRKVHVTLTKKTMVIAMWSYPRGSMRKVPTIDTPTTNLLEVESRFLIVLLVDGRRSCCARLRRHGGHEVRKGW